MLTTFPASGHADEPITARKVLWLDLLNPTDEERASVERSYGLDLPSREALSEVESSSRVSQQNGTLFLSMPIVAHASALDQPPTPLGFVLSKDLLVTLRYTQLRSFDSVAAKFSTSNAPSTGVETFVAVIDAMVDLSADLLEEIAAVLDAVSRAAFRKARTNPRHLTRSNDALRGVLIEVGNAGERLSRIRDILLGLQRIVPFVSGAEHDWIPRRARDHLGTAQNDCLSLTEYETHLSDRVQFLLDAVLGFISTKQNDIFQVLTLVSVVGIPPTLVASIYGMNFRNMPELTWAWGYQWGLGLIVLSTVVPLVWFKWRGWF